VAIQQLPSEGWPGGERPNTGAPLPESLVPGGNTDSAGFPWEGRTFDHHGTAFADDNGDTPEPVQRAIANVRAAVAKLSSAETAEGQLSALNELAEAHARAIASFTAERFLVPLIAEAGDFGLTPEGKKVEKSQELSIVTVQAPDGRGAIPVFTSVQAMQQWNPLARPIPVPGAQVALAAGQEETDLVIIDPGAEETEFVVRRPLLEAFALGQEVLPSWADPGVIEAFETSVREEPAIVEVILAPGDPQGRLQGPETVVGLSLRPGLTREDLQDLTSRLQERWSLHHAIAHRVDSLALQLRAAQ